MKSNWELGFAASVYLYVLKMIGSNVDDLEDKLHSILKSVNFFRIVGVNKIPEFLGFTFAMFNETCPDDACKLYYFMQCGDSVVVKLQILGLTFSPIRLGLWSTSWCAPIYCLRCSLEPN
jgi:hypothetical protein